MSTMTELPDGENIAEFTRSRVNDALRSTAPMAPTAKHAYFSGPEPVLDAVRRRCSFSAHGMPSVMSVL